MTGSLAIMAKMAHFGQKWDQNAQNKIWFIFRVFLLDFEWKRWKTILREFLVILPRYLAISALLAKWRQYGFDILKDMVFLFST